MVTTPGKNATAVAELTIAAMILVARRIPETMRHVQADGELFVDNYEGAHWFGHELEGHVLGLVGFGQIGRRVAERALAFGMRVLVSDPFVAASEVRTAGGEPVELDELLATADHVSLHARATAENRGFMDAARFGRMKRGAFLINTAREVLVDEDALVDALRSGHLGGAVLDLASPTPAGQPHRLMAFPTVLLLPHIGGATMETLANGGRMAAGRDRALRGRTAAPQPRQPGCHGPRRGRAVSASHTLAIDLGTGSCRAVVFDAAGEPRGIGQREWSHAALPGAPGSQVFDTTRGWQLVCQCIASALEDSGLAARDIAAVSSSGMREGMVLWDRDGREIWACPNIDSRAASEADRARALGRRAAHLRAGRRLGVDHLAGALPVDPRARAGDLPGHGPRGHAQRLGPDQADRPLRHRPLVRLQLGPLRPPHALLVPGLARAHRGAARGHARGPRAGHRHGRGQLGGGSPDGPRRGHARRGRRRATRSWGSSGWASCGPAR